MSGAWLPFAGAGPLGVALRLLGGSALLALVALTAGCASVPPGGGAEAAPAREANPADPFESFNRSVYGFNDALDRAVLKPVATVYRDAMPGPVQAGISHFFGNLEDLWSGINGVLQWRPREAGDNLGRFGVNTFLGLGGLLDIASEMGIERTSLDFGLTLGRWGLNSGPYLVLPLLGPSSVRDTAGRVVDARGDLLREVDPDRAQLGAYALRGIEARAGLLRAGELLEQAALDKYSFTRDIYLQRRQAQLGRGAASDEEQ